jgi:pilus assembly protein TadC
MVQAIIHEVSSYLVAHKQEIMWAAIFGLMLDLLSIRSRIRGVVRLVKNKWSEQSISRLRKRIAELEKSRDDYVSYMTSDKALYLFALRILLMILFSMSMGLVLLVFGRFPVVQDYLRMSFDAYALLFFALAMVGAWQGLRVTEFGERSKLSDMTAKLDRQIADLKSKLQERTESVGTNTGDGS